MLLIILEKRQRRQPNVFRTDSRRSDNIELVPAIHNRSRDVTLFAVALTVHLPVEDAGGLATWEFLFRPPNSMHSQPAGANERRERIGVSVICSNRSLAPFRPAEMAPS